MLSATRVSTTPSVGKVWTRKMWACCWMGQIILWQQMWVRFRYSLLSLTQCSPRSLRPLCLVKKSKKRMTTSSRWESTRKKNPKEKCRILSTFAICSFSINETWNMPSVKLASLGRFPDQPDLIFYFLSSLVVIWNKNNIGDFVLLFLFLWASVEAFFLMFLLNIVFSRSCRSNTAKDSFNYPI